MFLTTQSTDNLNPNSMLKGKLHSITQELQPCCNPSPEWCPNTVLTWQLPDPPQPTLCPHASQYCKQIISSIHPTDDFQSYMSDQIPRFPLWLKAVSDFLSLSVRPQALTQWRGSHSAKPTEVYLTWETSCFVFLPIYPQNSLYHFTLWCGPLNLIMAHKSYSMTCLLGASIVCLKLPQGKRSESVIPLWVNPFYAHSCPETKPSWFCMSCCRYLKDNSVVCSTGTTCPVDAEGDNILYERLF